MQQAGVPRPGLPFLVASAALANSPLPPHTQFALGDLQLLSLQDVEDKVSAAAAATAAWVAAALVSLVTPFTKRNLPP